MNDWRSKPRTGRAKIREYSVEIEKRLEVGNTNRQIYEYLVNKKKLTLSESQFNRYIKKCFHRPFSPDESERTAVAAKTNENLTEVKNEETEKKNRIERYEWNNIGITNEKTIEDLELNGLTPDEVKAWGLSEFQVRQKLVKDGLRKGK